MRRGPRPAKFDDCKVCRFRRRPEICAECDSGEQFEDASVRPLNFDNDSVIRRGTQSLVTDDDEPDINPDDLIERIDEDEEERNYAQGS